MTIITNIEPGKGVLFWDNVNNEWAVRPVQTYPAQGDKGVLTPRKDGSMLFIPVPTIGSTGLPINTPPTAIMNQPWLRGSYKGETLEIASGNFVWNGIGSVVLTEDYNKEGIIWAADALVVQANGGAGELDFANYESGGSFEGICDITPLLSVGNNTITISVVCVNGHNIGTSAMYLTPIGGGTITDSWMNMKVVALLSNNGYVALPAYDLPKTTEVLVFEEDLNAGPSNQVVKSLTLSENININKIFDPNTTQSPPYFICAAFTSNNNGITDHDFSMNLIASGSNIGIWEYGDDTKSCLIEYNGYRYTGQKSYLFTKKQFMSGKVGVGEPGFLISTKNQHNYAYPNETETYGPYYITWDGTGHVYLSGNAFQVDAISVDDWLEVEVTNANSATASLSFGTNQVVWSGIADITSLMSAGTNIVKLHVHDDYPVAIGFVSNVFALASAETDPSSSLSFNTPLTFLTLDKGSRVNYHIDGYPDGTYITYPPVTITRNIYWDGFGTVTVGNQWYVENSYNNTGWNYLDFNIDPFCNDGLIISTSLGTVSMLAPSILPPDITPILKAGMNTITVKYWYTMDTSDDNWPQIGGVCRNINFYQHEPDGMSDDTDTGYIGAIEYKDNITSIELWGYSPVTHIDYTALYFKRLMLLSGADGLGTSTDTSTNLYHEVLSKTAMETETQLTVGTFSWVWDGAGRVIICNNTNVIDAGWSTTGIDWSIYNIYARTVVEVTTDDGTMRFKVDDDGIHGVLDVTPICKKGVNNFKVVIASPLSVPVIESSDLWLMKWADPFTLGNMAILGGSLPVEFTGQRSQVITYMSMPVGVTAFSWDGVGKIFITASSTSLKPVRITNALTVAGNGVQTFWNLLGEEEWNDTIDITKFCKVGYNVISMSVQNALTSQIPIIIGGLNLASLVTDPIGYDSFFIINDRTWPN